MSLVEALVLLLIIVVGGGVVYFLFHKAQIESEIAALHDRVTNELDAVETGIHDHLVEVNTSVRAAKAAVEGVFKSSKPAAAPATDTATPTSPTVS
jgi:hypothetical protein